MADDDAAAAAATRDGIFRSLRDSGVVERLKAQVRAQVIDKLRMEVPNLLEQQRDVVGNSRAVEGGAVGGNARAALQNKVLGSLVIDYLQSTDCLYTLSLFVPEGGMETAEPLTRQELSAMLELPVSLSLDKENSNCSSKTMSNGKSSNNHLDKNDGSLQPLLLEMLRNWSGSNGKGLSPLLRLDDDSNHSSSRGVIKDSSTQTRVGEKFEGDSATVVLDRKLNAIYDQYTLVSEREALQPRRSAEERMIRYQRECDKRCADTIVSEVARFREDELGSMRSRERTLMRRELDSEREALQSEYAARVRRLEAKEAMLVANSSQRELELEQGLFEERQALLKRLEEAGTREQLEARKLSIDRAVLTAGKRANEKAALALEKAQFRQQALESELRAKHEDDKRTFRASVLADFEERARKLERDELRAQEEAALLAREKLHFAARLEAADGISTRLEKANAALVAMKMENEELRLKVQTFDSQIGFVKEAASHDRSRYDALYAQHVQLSNELESMRREERSLLGSERAKQREKSIRALEDNLSKVRSKADETKRALEAEVGDLRFTLDRESRNAETQLANAETSFRQRTMDIRDKLNAAEQELESLRVDHERATAALKTTEAENVELRNLLVRARKALDDQIADPPKRMNLREPESPPPPPPPPRREVTPSYPSTYLMPPAFYQQPMQIPMTMQMQPPATGGNDVFLSAQLAKMQESITVLMSQQSSQQQQASTHTNERESKISPSSEAVVSLRDSQETKAIGRSNKLRVSTATDNSRPNSTRAVSTRSASASARSASARSASARSASARSASARSASAHSASARPASARSASTRSASSQQSPGKPGSNRSRGSQFSSASRSSAPLSDRPPVVAAVTTDFGNAGAAKENKLVVSVHSGTRLVSPASGAKSLSPPSGTKFEDNASASSASKASPSSAAASSPSNLSPEEQATLALQRHREAQQRQRSLQQQRQRERGQRLHEMERRQQEELRERERLRVEEEARAAAEAGAAARAEEKAIKTAAREEEAKAKAANDFIINSYREKALAKFVEDKKKSSQQITAMTQGMSGDGGGGGIASSLSSPMSGGLAEASPAGSNMSLGEDDDAASSISGGLDHGSGSGLDSDNWEF